MLTFFILVNNSFKLRYQLTYILLLGFGLALSNAVFAEEANKDWFQLEYVVFEHLHSDRRVLRFEDVTYALPQRERYQILLPKGKPLAPNQFTQLETKDSDLADIVQRLRSSPKTKVHSSGGWRQAIGPEETLLPLKIAAGKRYGDHFQLEGELNIKRSRYLHVSVDVYLADFNIMPYEDIKDWAFTAERDQVPVDWLLLPLAYQHPAMKRMGERYMPVNVIHLAQSRRIKDGEIHYLDHPALGLIFTARKIVNPDVDSR